MGITNPESCKKAKKANQRIQGNKMLIIVKDSGTTQKPSQMTTQAQKYKQGKYKPRHTQKERIKSKCGRSYTFILISQDVRS